jgi:hypothetical protein
MRMADIPPMFGVTMSATRQRVLMAFAFSAGRSLRRPFPTGSGRRSCGHGRRHRMAGATGLEPATFGVTGQPQTQRHQRLFRLLRCQKRQRIRP